MDSIKKLQELFRKFPTIGSRTAGRFVFYLINQPKSTTDELIAALQELKNTVKLCADCFNPFESSGQLCEICQSPSRTKNLLCVVEKEADLLSIEKANRYKGLYFILGEPYRLQALKTRVQVGQFTEIILAINSTLEGKTASLAVEKTLKELSPLPQLTHLARGIPVGGELEYADEETLESAFEGRK